MGFALGGSVFWGLYGPNTTIEHDHVASGEQAGKPTTAQEKEKSDAALARYTFWLTLFTGVLAVATIGLGVATAGLYLTGEKQIRVTRQSNARQIRQMRASIATAEEANKLNWEIFAASRRPSLDVQVSLAGDFQCDGNSGLVEIDVVARNVGVVPALDIACRILTFPNQDPDRDIEQYRRLSGGMKSRAAGFGDILFPERTIAFSRPFTTAVWFKDNIEAGKTKGGPGPMEGLGVCVCVDYLSPSDDRHYQTGFIYMLVVRVAETNDTWTAFDLQATVIPKTDLRLVRHPVGAHAN
jgi:hypothetical protein